MFEIIQTLSPYSKNEDVLKINNTSSNDIAYTFGDILELDSEYTFSCWMKSDVATNTEIHISENSKEYALTTEWTKVVFTTISNIFSSKEVYFTIPQGMVIYAFEGQLEVGNKDTDFNTNPQDTTDSIKVVDDKVIVLRTDFTIEQGRIEALIKETTIENEDGTKSTLKDKYFDMNATVDGIMTNVGETTFVDGESLNSKLTSIKVTTDGIKTEVSRVSDNADAAKTLAEQNADKFSWLVKSGTDETNFVLTDRTADLVAQNINLKGLVTFSGLNSETQDKISFSNDTINDWAGDAMDGNTFINGGYLKTETITSDKLNVGEILADNGVFLGILEARDINADRIKSGHIKSGLLDVYGLNVLQKDTEIVTFSVDTNGEVTLRGSVESYNYETGKSGWLIKADGDAEFNDVIVRGDLITTVGGIAYDETESVVPVIWAGESYEQREYAPFIVYSDGSIKATKGNYSGLWTGDIKIGNISIIDPNETTGNDALLTIRDGDNGIVRVELTDTSESKFAQSIVITDNADNRNIELNQDGLIQTNGGIRVIGDDSFVSIERDVVSINDSDIVGNEDGLFLVSNVVYVGDASTNTNLTVLGDISTNNKVNVGREVNYDNVVSCKITQKGLDFSFNDVVIVTFNTNGGTQIANQFIVSGGYIVKPINPTRPQHVFDGWYKESTFNTPWNFETDIVTANTTIYAKWILLPETPNVVVRDFTTGTYVDGDGNDWEQGVQAKTPLVVDATVNDGGTLSYKWTVYKQWIDTNYEIHSVQVFEDKTNNTITVAELNSIIETPASSVLDRKGLYGTCTVTNTLNGVTSSVTTKQFGFKLIF